MKSFLISWYLDRLILLHKPLEPGEWKRINGRIVTFPQLTHMGGYSAPEYDAPEMSEGAAGSIDQEIGKLRKEKRRMVCDHTSCQECC